MPGKLIKIVRSLPNYPDILVWCSKDSSFSCLASDQMEDISRTEQFRHCEVLLTFVVLKTNS
ncbi:hypothetical protein PORCRE_1033 [Porphyromonas crevioricanis JCM 15906]|uniref:Uncharacterized protein n=1 Tax=Porphyromonas crevioricanis JCM 15906 TaxID=1305617 RepID=T1CQH7_9PORP|nr:hypothetical protein PORCRE_1033 [Porphyromonas crevioricanis JCM 15906]GAD08286.1 hypothetical protein PORCAN_1924 [Porphyromonas crevioricanis JCM 13913]